MNSETPKVSLQTPKVNDLTDTENIKQCENLIKDYNLQIETNKNYINTNNEKITQIKNNQSLTYDDKTDICYCEEENEDLNNQIQSKIIIIDLLESKIDLLQQKIEQFTALNTQINIQNEQIKVQNEHINEYKDQINVQNEQINAYKNQIEEYKNQNREYKDQIEAYKIQFEEYNNQNNRNVNENNQDENEED